MSGNVQQALGLEMDAIASSVIGGTLLTGGVGNVIGSFFGVLINGTISTLVKTNGKLLSSWSNIAWLRCSASSSYYRVSLQRSKRRANKNKAVQGLSTSCGSLLAPLWENTVLR